jgi:hypothetical protein
MLSTIFLEFAAFSVYANEEDGTYEEVVDPNYVPEEETYPQLDQYPGSPPADDNPQYDSGGYYYAWKIYSKAKLSDVYGPWWNGPSGWGPGNITLSDGKSVSNSYTGTLKVSKSKVDASVGFNISTTYSRTTSYSVPVPSGKEYTIIYRRRYDKWKVVQRQYMHVDHTNKWTNNYATIYPKKFDFFSYDWKQTNSR